MIGAEAREREWREAAAWVARNRGHVHMAGVCGVGMAGLAVLLRRRGFAVSGSDAAVGAQAAWLRDREVSVAEGHAPGHLGPDVEWVVRSAAVPDECCEVREARRRGIPVFYRGVVLPHLLTGLTSIAVTGTHGKTTTSTFIAVLLRAAERDPSWCIGGESPALGGVAGTGDGGFIVVEADESDGTAALYEPNVAVVTNVEFDHMEHFAGIEDFEDCFRAVMRRARTAVVFCADDPRAARLADDASRESAARAWISYGIDREAHVRGAALRETGGSVGFDVRIRGSDAGRVELPVPGRHNALNALAATATGLALGLPFARMRDGLGRVALPRRRFDRIVEDRRLSVISDYAHHPSEVAALMRTARAYHAERGRAGRLLAVFQPHRYTRTLALGPDFPGSFAGVDLLVLTPVYAASEAPLPGGSTWDLYARFRAAPEGPAAVHVAESLRQAWEFLRRELRNGDLLLVVGAGDVERVAHWAREDRATRPPGEPAGRPGPDGERPRVYALEPAAADVDELLGRAPSIRVLRDEPLARHTTWGVGGTADLWVEAGSEAELREVLDWCSRRGIPMHVLGYGSNVLASDLGVRGVTLRLAGGAFADIRAEDGFAVAGAGVSLAALLQWMTDRECRGLEFLEGVPGSVGGALRMNAGAFGGEIGDRVQWVRCMDPDGSIRTLAANGLGFAYRQCAELRTRIALEAGFRVEGGSRSEIESARRAVREKRAWQRGLRCAGSVFRNPAGQVAGRLVEQAGLKGMKVGGAEVASVHGNVIAAGTGVCACDVRALLEHVRAAVAARFSVALEPEVCFLP